MEHDAYQCGICTSGQIMSAVAMLKEPVASGPSGESDGAVREAMAGNLCRCGTYKNITAAIQDARHRGTSAAPEQTVSTFVQEQLDAMRTGTATMAASRLATSRLATDRRDA